jgi:hypothetical protein
MIDPLFLFMPGIWNGQGQISFSSSPDQLRFFTQWDVQAREGDIIRATQKVEMQGIKETLVNAFRFSSLTETSFHVELSNELLGTVQGTGLLTATQCAWEFRGHPTFEGFEVYVLEKTQDYRVHAEYASPDQYRTIIDGRLWRKVSE